jgi:hypothetical protein
MSNGLTQRLLAALWFMLAGGIPGIFLILYSIVQNGRFGSNPTHLLFLEIVIPGCLAAISGFLIGADILDREKVTTANQAAARGFYVSLLAWLAYVPILSETLLSGFSESLLDRLLVVLVFGSIINGWLMAIVGVGAGMLLFRFRKP